MSAGSSRLWLVPFIDLIEWRANSNEGASWDGPGRRDSRQDDLTNPAFVSESVVTKTNRYLGVEGNLFFFFSPSPRMRPSSGRPWDSNWTVIHARKHMERMKTLSESERLTRCPQTEKTPQNKRVMQSDQNFNVCLHNSSLTFRGKWQRRL